MQQGECWTAGHSTRCRVYELSIYHENQGARYAPERPKLSEPTRTAVERNQRKRMSKSTERKEQSALAAATCSATPIDDTPQTTECDCEFTPDPNEPSFHYLRRCQRCGKTWWSLHCPHDLVQGRCDCGQRGQVWPHDSSSARRPDGAGGA